MALGPRTHSISLAKALPPSWPSSSAAAHQRPEERGFLGKSTVTPGFSRWGKSVGNERAGGNGREGSEPEKTVSTKDGGRTGNGKGVNVGVGWCSHTHTGVLVLSAVHTVFSHVRRCARPLRPVHAFDSLCVC